MEELSRRRHVIVSVTIAVASAVLIGILFYGVTKVDTGKVPPVTIDKPGAPFRVAFIEGESLVKTADKDHFTLADLKGHPVILNFWASWCVSCREEARELEKFWEENRGKALVVGIAIQDQKEDAKKFADYFGNTYVNGLDEDGKAAIDYGVTGVPETFFIDRSGVIRHKEIGPVDAALLQRELPKIL
jgi:cytochrome c biogenesis protein CcmG, thiol:disulfide interchange protein DsbE